MPTAFVETPIFDAAMSDYVAEHGTHPGVVPGEDEVAKSQPQPVTTPLLDEVERDGIKVRGLPKAITAQKAAPRPARKAAPATTRKPRARR